MLRSSVRHLATRRVRRQLPRDMPDLRAFLMGQGSVDPLPKIVDVGLATDLPPYFPKGPAARRSVFVETYGCQMNVNDSEILLAVLTANGFEVAASEKEADIIFLNTCSIRDKAEQKIHTRLGDLRKRKVEQDPDLVVGVVGCMAERLKTKLLERDKLVDLVVGPDAYKTLPQLLQVVEGGRQAINTMLSADESYADIAPVRVAKDKVSAFVSIARGCNNMCSFCIVPHVRGVERSRPMESILREVQELSDRGYKEVVLLGQNVNVYNDMSEAGRKEDPSAFELTPGFGSMWNIPGGGRDFCTLIREVARVNPEMRVRFTSPHPKAFPLPLLELVASTPNICNSLHVPAQSGSTSVLSAMRRNYSREVYLDLVDNIRRIVPQATISTDMISGFCGETEEDHQATLSLMREVQYDQAFMFAYSMREKTHAHRALVDDVPADVKNRRLREVIETFHEVLGEKIVREIGRQHLVLVEGDSKRSSDQLAGRSDTNQRVIFDKPESVQPGDYCIVEIESANTVTLKGKFVEKSSLQAWSAREARI